MAEMIRPSFEKMAFLGEKSRDARFVGRVDATKDKLNVALNPIDSVAERRMNGSVSGIVKGLAENGEWSCDTVRSLVETVNDPTRSANRDVARERLDVLASSTYIVMTHGENEDLRQAVGTKDGALIDAALPESLRGIGGMVAEIATEQEITNPKLKEALKKLDRRADVLRASGSVGEEKLKELIGDKILELSELVDELDERGYDELTRVSAYLGAEAEKLGVGLDGDSRHRSDTSLDLSMNRAQREAAELARMRQPRGPNTGEGEEFTPYEASYDMKRNRFIEMEYNMQPIRWYDERPPQWYDKSEMSMVERELIDLRLKILNAAANKVYLRNRDIEKLRGNIPEITEHEFGLLWREMPGFSEALMGIVSDLCEEYTDRDGRILLRLKTQGPSSETPFAIDRDVKEKLEHFYRYKADYAKSLDVEGLTDDQRTEAVSTAWNFLYIGDSVESWDYFRELKPTVCVSDKLRTMDHPMIKALGKWGVWKGYQRDDKVVAPEGQEEPFVSGPLSSWVLDRLKIDPTFKQRLISGDLSEMLPRTMVVSMIESTAIEGGGVKMSLASALLHGRADVISAHFSRNDTDKNLMQPHNDMVQGGEFILNLIRGKIQYSYGKNDAQFVSDFIENTSLIRQEPNIPLVGGNLGTLSFVDRPDFFRWALTIACGFDPYDKEPLLNARSLGGSYDSYDLYAQDLVAKVTQRSSVDKKALLKMLAGSNIFEVKKRQMENARERMRRKKIM